MKKLTLFTLLGMAIFLTGCAATTETQTEQAPVTEEEVSAETTKPTVKANVYRNEEFGYQITLTENWKDYITESREIPNGKLIDFSSATKFTASGYAEIFNIAATRGGLTWLPFIPLSLLTYRTAWPSTNLRPIPAKLPRTPIPIIANIGIPV